MNLRPFMGLGLFALFLSPGLPFASDVSPSIVSEAERLMAFSSTAVEQKRYGVALVFAIEAYRAEAEPDRKTEIALAVRRLEEIASQRLPPSLSPTPEEIEKAYQKGLKAYVEDRLLDARKAFQHVLELDPGNISAFIALNRLRQEIKE